MTVRGVERRAIFLDDRDRGKFLDRLSDLLNDTESRQVSFEVTVDTECPDGRRVVIFDERMTVSKRMPIHAAIFTGCMLLNVILCLGRDRRTTEKSTPV